MNAIVRGIHVLSLIAAGFAGTCRAADAPANPAAAGKPPLSADEVAALRSQLEAQAKLIEQLRQAVESQRKMLAERGIAPAVRNAAAVQKTEIAAPPASAPSAGEPSPLQLRVGNTTVTPIGFMDATAVWRDKAAGTSIGTNFASIPYNNSAAGKLSEFRFSPQNSRIGFRVDGDWKGAHFIGYNEFDFLGTSGSNAIGVSNGAFVPRLRLFWVDIRKNRWEVLGGQSWSFLTPNRSGLSALPGDLFYSQVIDVNYMAGLTWARQAGVRAIFHPNEKVAMGISLENPNQYMGGSAGGPQIVLPSGLASLAGSQLDNASNVFVTPNVHPDVIAKVAFDPNSRVHLELAGIERTFKVWNPSTNQYSTKAGAGASINANVALSRTFRLITNNYWSDGGGRYLFGQAPDVVVRADGTLSPIHSGGTVDGFEATVGKNLLLYAYYGGIYVGRNVAIDANGKPVGYGFAGSAGSHNRALQEATFGFNNTMWKDAKYGAINLMGQYEYMFRNPWFAAAGAPKATHDNTIYMNLRYTLPGTAPARK